MVTISPSRLLTILSAFEDDTCCLKPISCEINTITRSDGSVTLTQGRNTAIVYATGPIEVKAQHMEAYRGTILLNYRPKCGQLTASDRLVETQLKEIIESAVLLDLYPRAGIQVALQELENNGSLLSCLINGSCLALVNAGIEMAFMYAAVTAALKADKSIILDPDAVQIENASAVFVFVFENVDKKLIFTKAVGVFSKLTFFRAKLQAQIQAEFVFAYYRQVIKSLSEQKFY